MTESTSSPNGNPSKSETLRQFLNRIGAKLGRSENQMLPVALSLEEEWYDSVESLRGIETVEQWAQLKLPKRLVDEIQKELGTTVANVVTAAAKPQSPKAAAKPTSSNGSAIPHPTSPKGANVTTTNTTSSSSSSSGVFKLNTTSGSAPSNINTSSNISNNNRAVDFSKLSTTLIQYLLQNDPSNLETCILTLTKLLHAVIKSPQDDSKRSINLSNPAFHQRVGRHGNPALDILIGAGFVLDQKSNTLVMSKPDSVNMNMQKIEHTCRSLQVVCQSDKEVSQKWKVIVPPIPMPKEADYSTGGKGKGKSNQPSKFNPFQETVSTLQLSQQGEHAQSLAEKRAQQAREERQKVLDELESKKKALSDMEKPDLKREKEELDGLTNEKLLEKYEKGKGCIELGWLQNLGSIQETVKKMRMEAERAIQAQNDMVNDGPNGVAFPGPQAQSSSGSAGGPMSMNVDDDDLEAGDHELLRDCLRCIQDTGAGKFKARENNELEILNRRKVYDNVIIRIVFPNKMTFQIMDCKPNDTIRSIYKKVDLIVKDYLLSGYKNTTDVKDTCTRLYYLYDTPPIRKFQPTSTKTLAAEGLAPGSVMHFGLKKLTESGSGNNTTQQYPEVVKNQSQKELIENNRSKYAPIGPPLEAEFYLKEDWLSKLPEKPKESQPVIGGLSSINVNVKTGNSAKSKLLGNNNSDNSNTDTITSGLNNQPFTVVTSDRTPGGDSNVDMTNVAVGDSNMEGTTNEGPPQKERLLKDDENVQMKM